MSRRRLRSKKAQQGFTLIEVMMAMAIMTVGALGIMAMGQAATRGNMEARQMTVATEVNRMWVERLRRDTLNWTNNQPGGGAGTVASTNYFAAVPPIAGAVGPWFAPVAPAGTGESFAFDWFGRDTTTVPQMTYCTHVRLSWVRVNDTVRAEARTFYRRRGAGVDGVVADQRLFPNCAAAGGEALVTAELALSTSRVKAVYATTLLRFQPLP